MLNDLFRSANVCFLAVCRCGSEFDDKQEQYASQAAVERDHILLDRNTKREKRNE